MSLDPQCRTSNLIPSRAARSISTEVVPDVASPEHEGHDEANKGGNPQRGGDDECSRAKPEPEEENVDGCELGDVSQSATDKSLDAWLHRICGVGLTTLGLSGGR